MWVLGVTLVIAVVGWVCFCLWRWWTSRIGEVMELQTISDARRKKYLSYVDQIADRYADGDLDARGVHLALAGLMRALGTERTGRDLEVATVSEVRELVPVWPGWRMCLRRARPRALRARIFRLGAPRTRL